MKKHLSFALLTVNILGLNTLPVTAVESTSSISSINNSKKTATEEATERDYQAIADGQWCVRIPAMGIFCWDL